MALQVTDTSQDRTQPRRGVFELLGFANRGRIRFSEAAVANLDEGTLDRGFTQLTTRRPGNENLEAIRAKWDGATLEEKRTLFQEATAGVFEGEKVGYAQTAEEVTAALARIQATRGDQAEFAELVEQAEGASLEERQALLSEAAQLLTQELEAEGVEIPFGLSGVYTNLHDEVLTQELNDRTQLASLGDTDVSALMAENLNMDRDYWAQQAAAEAAMGQPQGRGGTSFQQAMAPDTGGGRGGASAGRGVNSRGGFYGGPSSSGRSGLAPSSGDKLNNGQALRAAGFKAAADESQLNALVRSGQYVDVESVGLHAKHGAGSTFVDRRVAQFLGAFNRRYEQLFEAKHGYTQTLSISSGHRTREMAASLGSNFNSTSHAVGAGADIRWKDAQGRPVDMALLDQVTQEFAARGIVAVDASVHGTGGHHHLSFQTMVADTTVAEAIPELAPTQNVAETVPPVVETVATVETAPPPVEEAAPAAG